MHARSHAASTWMLAIASCGEPTVIEPYVTDRFVYSEFLPYDDVRARLPELAAHEVGLDLAMPVAEVGDDALAETLRAARRHGVPVRAWLLLSDADGYWPGEDNLPTYRDLVDDFWSWQIEQDLGVTTIVVDMEPPVSTSDELAAALEAGALTDVIPLLQANRDPEEHAAARAAWSDAVDAWHDAGIEVAVVALPFILDDFGDSDPDLQDMFESPLDGVPWDEVGFLVYQNLFAKPDGTRYGPALVHAYASTARERYGGAAVIALGTIGDIGKNTSSIGYAEPPELEADLAALAAAGVDGARLFSLDGIAAEGGAQAWLEELHPPAATPDPDALDAAANARALVAVLDSL